jgi:hypothetical protein
MRLVSRNDVGEASPSVQEVVERTPTFAVMRLWVHCFVRTVPNSVECFIGDDRRAVIGDRERHRPAEQYELSLIPFG